MRITYKSVTGGTYEIELNDQDNLAQVLKELDDLERKNNRAETRRHNSLEQLTEQGVQFADEIVDIQSAVEKFMFNEQLHMELTRLTPEQRMLLHQLFVQQLSPSQVAKTEGVTRQSISERISRIFGNLRKSLT